MPIPSSHHCRAWPEPPVQALPVAADCNCQAQAQASWPEPAAPANQACQSSRPSHRNLPLCALAAILSACSPEETSHQPPPPPPAPPGQSTPAAETALVQTWLDAGRPDLALAILASRPPDDAADAPPPADFITTTRWHMPIATIDHPGLRVDHLALRDDSLWVALAHDAFHTVVRWDLGSMEIAAVLAPDAAPLRAMVLSPDGLRLVVARGDVTLLADASSLAPIADLGPLPDDAAPESTVVFSENAIFLAHPLAAPAGGPPGWRIRDSATGEIIRVLDEDEPGLPRILCAHLDPHRLRLLAADGTLIDAPVTPIDPVRIEPLDEPADLLHAHFDATGTSALAVVSQGPLAPPLVAAFDTADGADTAPDPDALAATLPIGRPPGIATGLMRHLDPPALHFEENGIRFAIGTLAPLAAEGPIAIAPDPPHKRIAVGDAAGRVILHEAIDPTGFPHSPALLEAVAGFRYDPKSATAHPLAPDERAAARPDAPDFRTAGPAARDALWQRLASAFTPDAAQLPIILSLAHESSAAPWHAALTDFLESRKHDRAPANPPWSALPDLQHAANERDRQAFATALAGIPTCGPATALALAIAIDAGDADLIAIALDHAAAPPAILHDIAVSHIHLLQGHTAAAFQPWIDGFPDLDALRRREDWLGWEQADFRPAATALEDACSGLVAALTIDDSHDEDQRREIIARIADPETSAALGKRRYADLCLAAATTLADIAGETEATFQLASLARSYGAPPVPCLRAEALSLTALGDYRNAHTRWIELITEHPVDTHRPGDYAEAAYTAFENADSRQAVEILITGTRRFDGDADFALRAGWVALLTGNPDHAQAFLLTGEAAGFPEEKLENATALLAVAAMLNHDSAAAMSHYQDLVDIDPAWAEPETIESLAWPEHLKAPLRQLTW